MKVHIDQVQEGCILSNSIFSATNKPLAYKNTILNQQIIEALKAFLITEVEIEATLVDGTPFEISNNEEEQAFLSIETPNEKDFYDLYVEAVQGYKQLYLSWQSGSSIDIAKIRKVILHLVERLDEYKEEIFKLYHYSKQDDYIYHHSISVALLSAFLGKKLQHKQGDIIQIAIAGLLCDCGMSKVNPNILKKKITLTEDEYRDIKQHPVKSYNLLKNIMSIKEGVKLAVLQHHERIDGSGYPLGVKGDQLHPYSKIVALADTYQAMVTARPYRSKQSPFKVLEQIMQDEFGKFDLHVVNGLKNSLLTFSVGTRVKLTNNKLAEIVFIDDRHPTRPIIKLVTTNEIIALKDKRDLFIEELI